MVKSSPQEIGAKYIEASAKHNVGIEEAIFTVLVDGLIYYAELTLPDVRKEAAERTRVAEHRRQHPYTSPYLLPPDNTRSDGTRKTMIKSIRGFVDKTIAKLRS